MLNLVYVHKDGRIDERFSSVLHPEDLGIEEFLCFYWKNNCTADITIQYGGLKQ